ncbi:UNVERIFIED_CONTAM: hypothetical protein GTU68_055764, partial [Idotea baltica]|nr:hypothetical protein [Idotea baltica]
WFWTRQPNSGSCPGSIWQRNGPSACCRSWTSFWSGTVAFPTACSSSSSGSRPLAAGGAHGRGDLPGSGYGRQDGASRLLHWRLALVHRRAVGKRHRPAGLCALSNFVHFQRRHRSAWSCLHTWRTW